MAQPRSYSTGKRKSRGMPSSRVRVYERADVPGRFFMTRSWKNTTSGRPVEVVLPDGYSWAAAKSFADKVAAERHFDLLSERTETGQERPTTVGELLEKYHGWLDTQDRSPKTRDDKERCRKFWLAALQPSSPIARINAAQVERIAAVARRRGGHEASWDRKRLAYLRAAVRWGLNKAQLYDVNPLRGLELPDYNPDTQGKEYTARESVRLASPHPDVDWRVTLAASIILDTGRRISAVLAISAERDLLVEHDRLHVLFRRDFDKGKRDALVPVSAQTHLLIAEALEDRDVIDSGWLFPEGRIEYDDPTDKPFSKDNAIASLHRAESILGIPYVPGRAWHGLKRTHVTTSWEEAGGDAALVGDITGNVSAKLLKDTYRRLNRSRTEAHVDKVRARFEREADGE